MEYIVKGVPLTYEASGERHWGEERVLLQSAVDLTEALTGHEDGFVVERLFSERSEFSLFLAKTSALLQSCWREAGLAVPDDFRLDQYHTLVNDFSTHLAAVDKTKLLSIAQFPIPVGEIIDRVSTLCGVPLIARNPYDLQSVYHFRVVRPQQSDNNPLHRDVWLEDYDDCINLYIPIAGSDSNSSLILIPGSHHWPESGVERTRSGATINGMKFNVPAVTAIRGAYRVERPDPRENQFLLFSPYLIHGGAINLNTDKTRISIEMRLWKK